MGKKRVVRGAAGDEGRASNVAGVAHAGIVEHRDRIRVAHGDGVEQRQSGKRQEDGPGRRPQQSEDRRLPLPGTDGGSGRRDP